MVAGDITAGTVQHVLDLDPSILSASLRHRERHSNASYRHVDVRRWFERELASQKTNRGVIE